MLITRVVNLRHSAYDVYIGRAGHGQDGYFGNPIRTNEHCFICLCSHSEKGATLDCFERYARARMIVDEEYREKVKALYGKTLGCFCGPAAPCHGQTLAKLAAELNGFDVEEDETCHLDLAESVLFWIE